MARPYQKQGDVKAMSSFTTTIILVVLRYVKEIGEKIFTSFLTNSGNSYRLVLA